MRVQIFSVYYSSQNIIDNSCYNNTCIVPIQTGRESTGISLDMLGDNSGDNISAKNPDYGELTAWYWVWKNWLPLHQECEYIGFTQYRRLPVLSSDNGHYLKHISKQGFLKKAEEFTEDNVIKFIGDSDIVAVKKWNTLVSTEWEFTSFIPSEDWLWARKCFTGGNSDKEHLFDSILKKNSARYKCNFIMKTSLFCEMCSWLFPMLFEFESKRITDKSKNQPKIGRICAYITECFINLWTDQKEAGKNVKIKDMCIYEASFPRKSMQDNLKRLKWFVDIFYHLKNIVYSKQLRGEAYEE